MIHLKRHPIDIIHSWYLKSYGSDSFWLNPRSATPTFRWKKIIIPYYAVGWEDEYLKMNEMDRVINMINKTKINHEKAFGTLSNKIKKQIIIIAFEKFVTSPGSAIKELCSFLNTTTTDFTEIVLRKESVPRILDDNQRLSKKRKIKRISTPDAYKILMDLTEEYESGETVF